MTLFGSSRTRDPASPLRRIRVGAVSIYPLVQFHYRPDPARFFPDLDTHPVDREAWYWQSPYLEDGQLVVDMGGFLVQTPGRTILVDAGIGNGKTRPNPNFHQRSDDWFATLRRAGADVDDVDTVIFTHLHVDHVGYATSWDGIAWVPTFPNATYLTTPAELEFWSGPDAAPHLARLGDYVSDSVLPLRAAGVLREVAPDLTITDEIRLVPAPGHTPGNVCVEVRSGGARAVFAGDMVHHAVQLAFPDWSTDYCVDRHGAAGARESTLAGLSPDDLLIPSHFPGSVPGRVRPDGAGGYRYDIELGEAV